MTGPSWPPRDWRKLLALLLLSGGGMALTLLALQIVHLVADLSKDPWPLAYGLYGVLGGIVVVLVSLGWALGKSSISGSVAGAQINISGGEDGGQSVTDPPATKEK